MPAFGQDSLSRKNLSCQFMSYTRANKACQGKTSRLCVVLSQGKLVQLYTLHEQLKLVKENYWKKTCSSYTRARKATKELVKENLIFCAGLKRSNPSIKHLTARITRVCQHSRSKVVGFSESDLYHRKS